MTGVRMGETSRVVWRAVAGAGPSGCTLQALADRFEKRFDKLALGNAIASLRRCGYAANAGDSVRAVWVATSTPPGEETPIWQLDGTLDEHLADKAAAARARRSQRAEGQPAEPAEPPPAATLRHRSVFDLVRREDCLVTGGELGREPVTEPRFELHSTGHFVIHKPAFEHPVTLPPDVTRAMFRWLDQLAASRLSALQEVAAS